MLIRTRVTAVILKSEEFRNVRNRGGWAMSRRCPLYCCLYSCELPGRYISDLPRALNLQSGFEMDQSESKLDRALQNVQTRPRK